MKFAFLVFAVFIFIGAHRCEAMWGGYTPSGTVGSEYVVVSPNGQYVILNSAGHNVIIIPSITGVMCAAGNQNACALLAITGY